jgi:DNA-binding GntR family transcriptional regulator
MTRDSTAYTRTRERLREDILSGRLSPGSKLTVAALARRYDVSAMPVRAALQELRGQGLVSGEPRRAARVRVLEAEFVANVFDLRIAVLPLLYTRCVRFITNADIEELERIQDELEAAASLGDMVEVRRVNYKFHSLIYRIARNPEAAEVMDRNWALIDSLRAQLGFGAGRAKKLNRVHRKIIEALRRRDSDEAFQLNRLSSESAKEELIELLEKRTAGLPAPPAGMASERERQVAE